MKGVWGVAVGLAESSTTFAHPLKQGPMGVLTQEWFILASVGGSFDCGPGALLSRASVTVLIISVHVSPIFSHLS